jgi:lysyl-tRNA synthetase class 2
MALDDIRKTKIEKAKKLKEMGIDPYPSVSGKTHSIAEAIEGFDGFLSSKKELTLAGRIMALRAHGGSIFFDINDGSGKIQAYIKEDVLGKDKFSTFVEFSDIGDFIEVTGSLFTTKKNEKTVQVVSFNILSKALLPLPEKWHGLQDVEERFRKRYLDFIFNPEVKEKLHKRFKIIELLRTFFSKNGFLEVETPVLQTLAGGATARPFKSHMNDLDIDLYMRVAPELFLKRLLVGGFERVFEIARNFRNEGMDREHNPEFDMLEAYAAYHDYEWMMNLVEELMEFLSKDLFGKTEFEYLGKTINLKRPFKRIEFNSIIKEFSGLDYDKDGEKEFIAKAKKLGIKIDKKMSKAVIADEIYKKLARPGMIDPVFVINHPIELSPLTKKLPGNPEHVARFQLLIGGFEMMNAFSELNDPLDQRERFEGQEKLRKKGDEEAQRMDEDFIEALEYGMPPATGIGIGVDRLVVLLTNSHTLREILLFPLMKPVK